MLGLAGLGVAGRGWARLGEARRGKARDRMVKKEKCYGFAHIQNSH